MYRALLSKEINIDLKIAPDHPAFLNIVHAGFVYTSDGGFYSFFIFLFWGVGVGGKRGEGGQAFSYQCRGSGRSVLGTTTLDREGKFSGRVRGRGEFTPPMYSCKRLKYSNPFHISF